MTNKIQLNTCLTKTVLILVIVMGVFVILYYHTTNKSITDYDKKLKTLDKFLNLNLNELKAPNPTGTFPDSQTLTNYNNLFFENSEANLQSTADLARQLKVTNENIMTEKLNELDTNIKVLLADANKELDDQLGYNYERSQKINNIRQSWLSNIDELPYRALA